MNKDTFKAQKGFAGKKKPSMLRRCVGHNYCDRQIYLITMVTEDRRCLFGNVVGMSDALIGSKDEPRIILSELGLRVVEEWLAIERYHPEIKVLAVQMMPDHLHGILFVKKKMEKPLGMVMRGFKQSCNKHYRELILGRDGGVALTTQHTGHIGGGDEEQTVALTTQHTGHIGRGDKEQTVALTTQHTGHIGRGDEEQTVALTTQHTGQGIGEDRGRGLLFALGYNDKLLLRDGQLNTWIRYLADNPRRLLMKREHPDLFRVQRNVEAFGITFSAIGNRFLLNRPIRMQVQCSRSLMKSEIEAYVAECLHAARQGAVLVSPAISIGEKAAMRAAFNEGFPLIYIEENDFTDFAKPGGRRMEACAKGQLLIIAPWKHHNEKIIISRGQCLELNDIARRICEGEM